MGKGDMGGMSQEERKRLALEASYKLQNTPIRELGLVMPELPPLDGPLSEEMMLQMTEAGSIVSYVRTLCIQGKRENINPIKDYLREQKKWAEEESDNETVAGIQRMLKDIEKIEKVSRYSGQ